MLIAHGLFGSAANWRTAARRFGQDRPVFSVDMRNHGDSAWVDGMDYEAMARDLLLTLDRLVGKPAILLGHSMGGKAAMGAALLAPEKAAAAQIACVSASTGTWPAKSGASATRLGGRGSEVADA